MMPYQSIVFLLLLTILYFVSRTTIHEVFYFFYALFKKHSIVNIFVSLLFFPGTVIHETAHLVVALLLLLKVRHVTILPQWSGTSIKLGSVTYEKQDFIRGILVGIAPIIVGVIILGALSFITNTFLLFYLIFTVSTTMFSSKQDLVDLVYVVPVLIAMGAVIYIFQLPILDWFMQTMRIFDDRLLIVNRYLLYSLGVHAAFILVAKNVRRYILR